MVLQLITKYTYRVCINVFPWHGLISSFFAHIERVKDSFEKNVVVALKNI